MKNIVLSCLAATALIAGCGGSGGSNSAEDQGPPAECPEAGKQPEAACLAKGDGEFLKSKDGAFGYKIMFAGPQIYNKGKTANQMVVVFDKNQCASAMDAAGVATFRPWMDDMDHGLKKYRERVRTVRDETCKNVFLVSEVYYPMPGDWQFYLEPRIARGNGDIGKVSTEVK